MNYTETKRKCLEKRVINRFKSICDVYDRFRVNSKPFQIVFLKVTKSLPNHPKGYVRIRLFFGPHYLSKISIQGQSVFPPE
jgi:predicted nucleic acid-binding OB-fold protein